MSRLPRISKIFGNYTEIIRYKEERYAVYNKINGKLVVLNAENIAECEQGHWLCIASDNGILKYLEDNLFFADDAYVQNIIRATNQLHEDYNDVTLVISTTEQCNCRCEYCYQHEWSHSDSIPDDCYKKWIIDYLQTVVDRAGDTGKITIRYFGGEPLIKLSFILDLNHQIERIVKQSHKGIVVHYEMDTNCTLLSRDTLSQFSSLSVATTLTMPDDHNLLRSNSFNKVMANLTALADLFELPQYSLNIGYNAHHGNIDQFPDFLNFIKSHKICCQVYVVNIVNYPGTHFTNMLDDAMFEEIYCTKIIPRLLEFGYEVDILPRCGLSWGCKGKNIINKKLFSNGTQALCSFFPKRTFLESADFPVKLVPTPFVETLPSKCIECYDFPYCGGERPCIACNGVFADRKKMRRRIVLYLDLKMENADG